MSKYWYNEIRTKVKCTNADCYWNSGHDYCIKDEIHINIDLNCTSYEPKEYEGDTCDDKT